MLNAGNQNSPNSNSKQEPTHLTADGVSMGCLLRYENPIDGSACEVRDVLESAFYIDDLNILQLFAFCLVWLLKRSELALDHRILHIVSLSGAYASEESGFIGAKVDEMDIGVRVLVVESGGSNDVSVLLLQRTAGDYNALGTVLERHQCLVSEQYEPIPSVCIVQGNAGSHFVDVRFRVELSRSEIAE